MISAAGLVWLAGCASAATVPPDELVRARTVMARVAGSCAPARVPDAYREAQRALDAAEHAFRTTPADPRVRVLSVEAVSRAESAELASDRALLP